MNPCQCAWCVGNPIQHALLRMPEYVVCRVLQFCRGGGGEMGGGCGGVEDEEEEEEEEDVLYKFRYKK